jgi:hypothetical protein
MIETSISGGCGCGCGSPGACAMLPAEFVRVRYYFGQRLGVMELNDQFLYHAGKMVFHNSRLHGFGVLCGLKVEKQKPPAGTASTVLRVSAGAAIDPCGREIAVGIDQCVDVAAWFAKNKSRPALAGWTANTTQTLRVAVRFRECPSDPSPAPRDPCGCDNGGCEYGRIQEVFEFGLFTAEEQVCAVDSVPSSASLLALLEGSGSAGSQTDPATALKQGIDTLVASGCPLPSDRVWLCLASLAVQLDATPVPVDLSDPDNTIAERRTLLTTRALQDLLLDLASDAAGSGLLSAGPHAGAISFEASTTNPAAAGTLSVQIQLAQTGTPPTDVPLVAATFDADAITVSRLDASGWVDVTPSGGVTLDTASTPPRLAIAFTQDLAAGQPFVLAFEPPAARPLVDANGAPLRRFTRRFRFVLDSGGALALDATL